MLAMIVYLVVLSVWLNDEMKSFGYGENMFLKERRAMKVCMIVFCTGYGVQVVKNLTSALITQENIFQEAATSIQDFLCSHNVYVNLC